MKLRRAALLAVPLVGLIVSAPGCERNRSAAMAGAGRSVLAPADSAGPWGWVQVWGLHRMISPTGLAEDADGRLYVSGIFDDRLTLGDTTITVRGDFSSYVVAHTPDGRPRSAHGYGGAGSVAFNHVAAHERALYVAANVRPTDDEPEPARWAAGARTIVAPVPVAVLARLDPGGAVAWAVPFGASMGSQATAVAAGPGGALVGGNHAGTLQPGRVPSYGGAPPPSSFTMWGFTNGFVAALSPSGDVRWVADLAVEGGRAERDVEVSALAAHPDGTVCVAGSAFADAPGALSVAGTRADVPRGGGAFVARLGASGEVRWLRVLTGSDEPGRAADPHMAYGSHASFRAVTATPSGGCVAVGSGRGVFADGARGGAVRASNPYEGPIVAAYDADGALGWVTAGAGSRSSSFASGVAVFGDRFVVVGSFIGRLTLGPSPVGASSGERSDPHSGFVAVLGAGGAVEALVAVRGGWRASVEGVLVRGRTAYVMGGFHGWADFAGRRVGAERRMNGFVARLELDSLLNGSQR